MAKLRHTQASLSPGDFEAGEQALLSCACVLLFSPRCSRAGRGPSGSGAQDSGLTAPLVRRYDMQGEVIALNMYYCEDIRDGHHVYYLPLRVTWHSRSSACADTKTPYAYDVGSGQDYLSHALIACWLRRSRAVHSYTSDT